MVRTLDGALELVRTRGLITEVPATGILSLAEAVIGGPVSGGVWQHARGNLIFRLGKALRASPEVLAVRLWEGKMTFVDQRLWPEVFRVAMESARRRPSLQGLSRTARELLERTERDGSVRLPQHEWTKERETLEARLLVQSSDVLVDGRYWAQLQSWRHWATPAVTAIAGTFTYAEAMRTLTEHAGGADLVGPWLSPGLT